MTPEDSQLGIVFRAVALLPGYLHWVTDVHTAHTQ